MAKTIQGYTKLMSWCRGFPAVRPYIELQSGIQISQG